MSFEGFSSLLSVRVGDHTGQLASPILPALKLDSWQSGWKIHVLHGAQDPEGGWSLMGQNQGESTVCRRVLWKPVNVASWDVFSFVFFWCHEFFFGAVALIRNTSQSPFQLARSRF